MKFLKKSTLLCAGILIVSCLHAQDKSGIASLLQQINRFYEVNKDLHLELEYKLYKDHTSDEVVDHKRAGVYKFQQAVKFVMGDIETFSDDQYDIMVHHTDKVLVVAPHQPQLTNPWMQVPLDTLLKVCSHFQKQTFGDVDCIYMGFEGSEAKGISVCYHRNDNSLYALTTYYREERQLEASPGAPWILPRLEIRFLKASKSVDMTAEKMKNSWYVRKTGSDFKPAPSFSAYRIINQIPETSHR